MELPVFVDEQSVHSVKRSLFFSEEDVSTATAWIERSMVAQQSAFSSGEICAVYQQFQEAL